MERVRLGLIGMGIIGTPHANTLQKVDECALVGIMEMLVDLHKLGIGVSRNSLFGKPTDFSECDYHAVRRMFGKE